MNPMTCYCTSLHHLLHKYAGNALVTSPNSALLNFNLAKSLQNEMTNNIISNCLPNSPVLATTRLCQSK